MKKIAYLNLLFLSVAVLLGGCRKDDNSQLPDLTRFPLPQVAKVAGTDQVISAVNPTAFNAKFTVGLYFPNDVPPSQMDVVVIKNGNKSIVKTIQANVTSFPATITITGTDLQNLFGAPIVLGDKFDISVDVTTLDGKKYEAFPITGAAYAAGVAAQPGSSTFIRYEAVCQYNPDQYQGNFVVLTDEWADYPAGTVIQLTKIDATHFSFKYAPADPKPIIVTVNPITNAVTVAKQVYGSGYPPGWPYGDISAESVPSVNNFVAPCDGTFSVLLKHTVAAGTIGEYRLLVKKQ